MKQEKGFTLLEIIVVMFIIGLFLFFAVPKFQDLTQVNLKSASRNLTGTIKYLYNEAAFKKKIYRLVFDLENNEYWVQVLEGSEYTAPLDSPNKRYKLPNGVYFKDVITERTLNKSSLVDEGEFILFLPTGFVEPAVIHIATDNNDQYTLETKPYTGGTRVYDEYVELPRR